MMSEDKFTQNPGKELEVAPEEKTSEGKIVKKEAITYQPKGFEEPTFGDKMREFEKGNNLLRMSAEQIARLFVEAINSGIESIVVGDDIKNLLGKTKNALDSWLTGHSYKVSKPEDIAGYLGAEVGKEVDNILKAEGSQGKAKVDKIKERNYWGQFKEQVVL